MSTTAERPVSACVERPVSACVERPVSACVERPISAYVERPISAYVERPVHAALADSVVCTWVDGPSERRQPVLPDGCIDIVWDGMVLSVAGPDTRSHQVASQATFAGIRFKPGAAPGFLGVAASELVDRTIPLGELWGDGANELAERLAESPSFSTAHLLEAAVRARGATEPVDPLMRELLRALSRGQDGGASVASLAKRLDVSERTLRRRCISEIGYGPKTLDRILRFRRALSLIQAQVPLVDAAQLAGYVDQAHLTHEFQRLAGATPGQLSSRSEVVISSNGLA